jgi:hypothetical protein
MDIERSVTSKAGTSSPAEVLSLFLKLELTSVYRST